MEHFNFSLPLRDPVLIFSIVLLVILLAPILLEKFKIPSLVGLILAGLALGPHGSGILRMDSSIILFGTVGLLYIMFMAALEMDINQLRKNKYRSLLFGLFTFAFPFGIGLAVCRVILGFDWIAAMLVSSMFSTHTLLAYPIVSHFGIARNPAVLIAVGGTVITDTLVLLLLPIITGFKTGSIDQEFWIKMGLSLIGFSVVIFGLMPKLARWFFKNLEAEKTSHFIFVLALVFFSAFLAKLAGMEPIIGAFAAGLSLNRLIPHASPLMNRIEFVGNALFVPFFLIKVGMMIDLSVLFKGTRAVFVAVVLTVVALLGKWIAAFVTQNIFRYSRDERNLIFGLSTAHAAATLAVILVGFNLGIVDESVLNGTIVLILVTCLVATFVTEKAGRHFVVTEVDLVPEFVENPEKFLLPIANPQGLERLLELVLLIRNKAHKQPVTLLSVAQDEEEIAQRSVENKRTFDKAIAQAAATDSKVHMMTRFDFNVASGISRAARDLDISDIVVGWAAQSSTSARMFGTLLDNLIRNTSKTTLVCHLTGPMNIISRVIVLVPSNAEFEVGFTHWIDLLQRIVQQVGAKCLLYCTPQTGESVSMVMKKLASDIGLEFRHYEESEHFLNIAQQASREPGDLFVLVSSRDEGISHNRYLNGMPARMANTIPDHNFIILYPEQS